MTTSRERSTWSDQVAAQIRAERAASGLTQAEVITASGMTRSTYLRVESGERVADTTQLARLCGVFNLPLSVFFRRVEERVAAIGGDGQ